jgi:hypothetical protein
MMDNFKRKGSCKAQRIPVPFTVPADQSTTGEDQHGNANDWLVEYDGGKKAPVGDESFQRDWQKCETVIGHINGPFVPRLPGILDIMEQQRRLNPPPTQLPYIGDPPPWSSPPRVWWQAPDGTTLGETKVTC